jgi:hypothetical protein
MTWARVGHGFSNPINLQPTFGGASRGIEKYRYFSLGVEVVF